MSIGPYYEKVDSNVYKVYFCIGFDDIYESIRNTVKYKALVDQLSGTNKLKLCAI